jgi:predicted adenine nucleotide alpha hydrolase (AANH) superfamily ATPase/VanZ family protein
MKFSRSINLLVLAAWLAFITWLLVIPVPQGLSLGTSYDDKIVHIAMFSILAYLLIETLESFYILKFRLVVLLSLVISIAYAQLMEFIQSFIVYRSQDVWDFTAGLSGALIAASLVLWHDHRKTKKPKLLLHICCIGCGVSLVKKLSIDYDVYLYFYNPNISPKAEFKKRLEEIRRVAKIYKLKVIISHTSHKHWLKKVKGHETDPERGSRCTICYHDRLAKTAQKAHKLGFDAFTTTLSISPHKNYPVIKKIGNELAEKFNIKFIDEDFKKNGGFQKSCEVSRQLELYRQDYCGCEFSIRKPS